MTELTPGPLPRRTFAALALVLLVVYLAFPNRLYPYDSVEYSLAVRSGLGLYHPHHIAYNWLGHVLYVALSSLTRVEPLHLLSALNALITVGAVLVLMTLIARLTARPWLALALGALYGVAFGTWHMGTSVEVYPATLLFELLALQLLAAPSSAAREATAGLLSALGVLFHQTGVFFGLAALPLLLGRPDPWPRLARFASAAVLGCAIPYLLVLRVQGIHSAHDALDWVLLYAHSSQFARGEWGGGGHLSTIPTALVGFVSAIALPAYMDDFGRPGFRIGPGAVLASLPIVVFIVALVAAAVTARRHRAPAAAPPVEKALVRTIALWALFECAFAFWWVPWNFEFWLLALPPLTLLLALGLRHGADTPRLRALVTIAAAGLAVGNFATRVLHDADGDGNHVLAITRQLGTLAVRPDDLVLSNISDLDPYSAYFLGQRLHVVSIRDAADAAGLDRLRADIDAELAAGHRVFALESELEEARGRWSADEVRRFYAARRPAATVAGHFHARGRDWAILELHK